MKEFNVFESARNLILRLELQCPKESMSSWTSGRTATCTITGPDKQKTAMALLALALANHIRCCGDDAELSADTVLKAYDCKWDVLPYGSIAYKSLNNQSWEEFIKALEHGLKVVEQRLPREHPFWSDFLHEFNSGRGALGQSQPSVPPAILPMSFNITIGVGTPTVIQPIGKLPVATAPSPAPKDSNGVHHSNGHHAKEAPTKPDNGQQLHVQPKKPVEVKPHLSEQEIRERKIARQDEILQLMLASEENARREEAWRLAREEEQARKAEAQRKAHKSEADKHMHAKAMQPRHADIAHLETGLRLLDEHPPKNHPIQAALLTHAIRSLASALDVRDEKTVRENYKGVEMKELLDKVKMHRRLAEMLLAQDMAHMAAEAGNLGKAFDAEEFHSRQRSPLEQSEDRGKINNNRQFLRDHQEARQFLLEQGKKIPGLIFLLQAATTDRKDLSVRAKPAWHEVQKIVGKKKDAHSIIKHPPECLAEACQELLDQCAQTPSRSKYY